MGWKFWNKKNKKDEQLPESELSQEEENDKEKAWQEWYDYKTSLMEKALGQEHDMVVHAIISYEIGGALHSYLYPNGIEGTGLATKQLARIDHEMPAYEIYGGDGPSNSLYDSYEIVMFTREDITQKELSDDPDDTFYRMRTLLHGIAEYSENATLNPMDTLEFPDDWDGPQAGRCAILAPYDYENKIFDKKFGLMLLIEIHQSEMKFAMDKGGFELIQKLIDAGHYPYSDLNREPVV